jgi:hypothetical protein
VRDSTGIQSFVSESPDLCVSGIQAFFRFCRYQGAHPPVAREWRFGVGYGYQMRARGAVANAAPTKEAGGGDAPGLFRASHFRILATDRA